MKLKITSVVGALALSAAAVVGPCIGTASASPAHTSQVGDQECGVKIGNVDQVLSDQGGLAAFGTMSNNFYAQFFRNSLNSLPGLGNMHLGDNNQVCGQIRQLAVGENGKNGGKTVLRALIEDNATRQIVWVILTH